MVDSLALAYRRAVRQAAELSGQDVEVVHVVGGGVRNTLLCQLTADATGLPVVADSFATRTYEPEGERTPWDRAQRLLWPE